jgi:hypothetical protein
LISEIRTNVDQNIVKRSNYIAVRLFKSYEYQRKQLPSDNEILHIENMKSIMFPVYFFSETHTMVPILYDSKRLKNYYYEKITIKYFKNPILCFIRNL